MTLSVTDHAVLRYIERVMGVDIELVRATIAAIPGLQAAVGAGATSFALNGIQFIIKNGVVATVGASLSAEKFRREGRIKKNGVAVRAYARHGRSRGDNRKPVHLPSAEVDG